MTTQVFISALPTRPATRLRMRGAGDRLCAEPNGARCIWWRSAQLFFLARHARAIRARECNIETLIAWPRLSCGKVADAFSNRLGQTSKRGGRALQR